MADPWEKGPGRGELSLHLGLSLLLHGALGALVLLSPELWGGRLVRVPVAYEVSLVGPLPAPPKESLAVPPQAKPAAPTRLAPPAPPVSEELTLPGRRKPSERRPPPMEALRPRQEAVPPPASRPAISPPGQAVAVPSPEAAREVGIGPAGESGVSVDIPDFRFPYYLALIQYKVSSHWAPPKIGPGRVEKVIVSFKILRSGAVKEIRVDEPSGDRFLDDSALRAIRLSSPMPPLPPLFKEEALALQLRFTYVGEKG